MPSIQECIIPSTVLVLACISALKTRLETNSKLKNDSHNQSRHPFVTRSHIIKEDCLSIQKEGDHRITDHAEIKRRSMEPELEE